jgi:hypothetical protein
MAVAMEVGLADAIEGTLAQVNAFSVLVAIVVLTG